MNNKLNQICNRKVIVIVVGLVVFMAAVFGVNYFVAVTPPIVSPNLVNLKSLTQPAVNPVWPSHGSGAIGVVDSEGILVQFGSKRQLPIASITKIITALVVLEKVPLSSGDTGPNIKLTENDRLIYQKSISAGAASQPVVVGGSVTQRQMLQAILLPSAANYSETMAIWAYGSVDNYLAAANAWLAKNGLTQTKVVDTSGLLSGNVSTTSDLIKLGRLALKNSALSSIVSLKKVDIPGIGEVNNSNDLIGELGVNGIKTGTTSAAGACLLFSSTIKVGDEKVTIAGVLVGADSRSQQSVDVVNLLKSVQPGFRQVKLVSRGQEFANYSTAWGQSAKLISDKDINAVVWSDTPISIKVNADKIKTIKTGEKTGEIIVSIDKRVIEQPLATDGTIDSPGVFWRLTHLGS